MKTLDQLDHAVHQLQDTLRAVGDEALALTQLATYQRLTGEGGWPKVVLRGETADRVTPALTVLADFWAKVAAFNDVLHRAEELRTAARGIFQGRSAQLELDRMLTTAAPAKRVKALTSTWDSARAVVLELDAAWARLAAELVEVDADATILVNRVKALEEAAPDELLQAKTKIATLRDLFTHDPLAVTTAHRAEIQTLLRAAQIRLEDLANGKTEVAAGLAEARDLLRRLQLLHENATKAAAERELKVLDVDERGRPRCYPGLFDAAHLAALGPWLEKLEATLASGKWKPARVGLTKWRQIATQAVTMDEAALVANDVPLRERRDLRGLLDALKVKAQTQGRAEDVHLGALADRAWALLNARPTPLAEARALVRAYQERLL